MACAFCLAVLLTSCGQKTAAPPVTSATSSPRIYDAKGIVKKLESDGKTIVVSHEAIAGYMQAMTMPFEVRDTNLLRGLKTGDTIMFKLAVTPTEGWIQDLAKLDSAAPSDVTPGSQPVMHVSRALAPLDIGDRLPDYHFTNELGEAVSLSQFKGQVLAFTFFFTSCPFPEYCPRMTSNFGKIEQELKKMTNAPARWHLLSISFDPAHDSPSRLASYADAADYDKSHWSFLTGDEDQIGALADQIGENYWHEGTSIGHNLRTVVVDASGHIRDVVPGSKWNVQDLVDDIVKAGQ
ncbi:MAG TPA: SCO family protein [Verrucomicrobiae bacterium]|jgi:protein SCO1/2